MMGFSLTILGVVLTVLDQLTGGVAQGAQTQQQLFALKFVTMVLL